MAWSTRQLADIAGVTLRSVRHWHEVGLLPSPDRLSNGYKQYTPRHLVRVLRISRLTGLGFSLDDVARMLDSDEEAKESLGALRAELGARIDELERLRSEVDELIDLGASPDLSPRALLAMQALGDDPVGRNIAIVMAHLTPEEDTAAFVAALADAPPELQRLNSAIWEMPEDAAEHEISALADQAVRAIVELFAEHHGTFPGGWSATSQADSDVIGAVVTDTMNTAQRRVMHLVLERLDAVTGTS
jgi:DNA-binding transcriptional MerR regulator